MIKKQFLKIACALSIGFLFAGCASDEQTDDSQLPEGKYPLVINAVNVIGDVQTRVSENATDGNSSEWDWDGSEQIGVQLYENGETASYALKSDQTLTATDNQLYWNSTASTTVYAAWYPFVDGTIDLSKQNTDGLAYVMKGTGSGDYKNGVSLSFTHQLAKVRVKIAIESTVDMSDATISVLNYANCTSTKGDVTANGNQAYIPMKESTYTDGNTYYEANVVAGTTLASDAFQIVTNGKTVKCSISSVELKAGELHVVTLTMIKQINLSNGGDINITDNGTYTLTGSGTKPININGSPTIYLDNAQVTVTDDFTPAVNITEGSSPTIYVKGMDNSLSSSKYGGIIMSNNANVKITGEGRDACKLTVKAGTEASNDNWTSDKSELMSFVGIGAATKCTCGNITIENVQLTVTGGHYSNNRGGAAAIGTSGPAPYSTTQCGEININAAQINATSGAGAAAIGTSYTGGAFKAENTNAYLICGKINIVNSSLSITVKPVTDYNYYGAGIGTGFLDLVSSGYAYTKISEVVIDCHPLKEEVFTEDFKLGGSIGNAGDKIGWGFHNCGSTAATTIGCPNHTIGGLYYYYNSSDAGFSSTGYPGTWGYR